MRNDLNFNLQLKELLDLTTVYTIGHSNQSIEAFLELLERHDIKVLVDVRSNPFSRYSHQFDHDRMKASVTGAGMKYWFLGRELGGKPKDESFYEENGDVKYEKLEASVPFKEGIARLLAELSLQRVALVCGEENPAHCHRRLLIGRVLQEDHQVEVVHIRKGGVTQKDAELDVEKSDEQPRQLSLFDTCDLKMRR